MDSQMASTFILWALCTEYVHDSKFCTPVCGSRFLPKNS